jgi:hypothetical protein
MLNTRGRKRGQSGVTNLEVASIKLPFEKLQDLIACGHRTPPATVSNHLHDEGEGSFDGVPWGTGRD